ncbi:MAG: hypothetical protein QOH40_2886, partial [Arthrobacter pascens]|nr:hypothetical protein [Arthrobacter pascens]
LGNPIGAVHLRGVHAAVGQAVLVLGQRGFEGRRTVRGLGVVLLGARIFGGAAQGRVAGQLPLHRSPGLPQAVDHRRGRLRRGPWRRTNAGNLREFRSLDGQPDVFRVRQ